MDGIDKPPVARLDTDDLRIAVEASREAILVTSADLDEPGPLIEYANPAFLEMTGYRLEEVLGSSPRMFQGPSTNRSALDEVRTRLGAGEPFTGEAINYRKDGTTYTVEWLITPVKSGDGRITRWISAQRDVTERRVADDRQELLVRELHHRVKNTLATVQAVMNATLRSSQGLDAFRDAFTNRIASLAKTHSLITDDRAQAVPFGGLLWAELQAYDEPGRDRILLDGPEVLLPSETAVPVGMALHELATNAVKHGALNDPHGRVAVTWTVEGGSLAVTWNEHDGPPVPLPTSEGFGSRLLKRILTAQIGADVDIDFDPDGLRVSLNIPLRRTDPDP